MAASEALPDPSGQFEADHRVLRKLGPCGQMFDMIRVGQTRSLLLASSALAEICRWSAHRHLEQQGPHEQTLQESVLNQMLK